MAALRRLFCLRAVRVRMTLVLCAGFLVAGCEAKLDLSEVEAERQKPTARFDQFQAAAQSDGRMLVVGSGGVILRSTDNGKSWSRTELKVPGEPLRAPGLIDVSACSDGSFVVLDIGRRVWVSVDGEAAWQPRSIDMVDEPLALTCDPKGRLWVVGGFSALLVSEDKGVSWNDMSFGEDAMLTTVQFVDDQYGIVTGEFGSFFVTEDGGQTWDSPAVIPNDFYPQDALFVNRREGWVVGLTGLILHTADSGMSWQRQDSGTEVPLYGLAQAHGRIYAVGDHATLLIYRDGVWSEVPRDQRKFGYLRAVLPVEEGKILVAGGAGTLTMLDQRDQAIPFSEKVASRTK